MAKLLYCAYCGEYITGNPDCCDGTEEGCFNIPQKGKPTPFSLMCEACGKFFTTSCYCRECRKKDSIYSGIIICGWALYLREYVIDDDIILEEVGKAINRFEKTLTKKQHKDLGEFFNGVEAAMEKR